MRSVLRVFVWALAASAGVALCSSLALAQPGGGRGGRGGGGFGFGGPGGGGSVALLQDDKVREELGLVDDQVSKLRDIATKTQEDMRAQFAGFDFGSLRDLSEEERNARFAEIREKGQKVTDAAQKQIEEVLLPDQRKRLKELEVQQQMRSGADRALGSGALADQLGITEEQKQKLAEKQREVQTSLREKMEKIRQEAEDELLSVLTPAQQAKMKELVGKPFAFSQGGFGGFGGPGGPGGGGPGGPGGGGRGGRGGNGGGPRLERPADGD